MIKELFKKPFVGAIIGDAHTGKSNLIYHILEELQEHYTFNLVTYGLRYDIKGARKVYSIIEVENIKNSVLFLDEFSDLFDLEDRRKKAQVERTLRLLFHNNNIIILSGLPENFKKFISAKVSVTFYKKVTFEDFINGSKTKKQIVNYQGPERGSSVLNIGNDRCLVFDGEHYHNYEIPYVEAKDSKRNNVPIFVHKKVQETTEAIS